MPSCAPGSTRRRWASVRTLAALACLPLFLVACDPSEDAPDTDVSEDAPGEDPGTEADDDPGAEADDDLDAEADDAPDDPPAGADQELAADVEAALPEGWTAALVEDEPTGAYVLGAPEEAAVWWVGEDLDPLFVVADGTDWWEFWQPRLVPLEPDVSNIRAMAVAPGEAVGLDADEVVSFQVNLTPFDLDVDPDDAEAIAEIYAGIFESQGSDVTDVDVVDHPGPEVDAVAELAFTLPAELIERDVRQRFVPVPEVGALWSLQCDVPSGADLDEVCDIALDAFRPPPTD